MELRDYLRVIRQRWRLIAACLVLAVSAAAVVTFRATPLYAASTQLFVSTPLTGAAEAYQGGLFSQQRVTSYADLVTGEEIARRVIEDQGLRQTPAELADNIQATVVPETVILTITVTDPGPERAQALADSVAGEFTSFVAELETPSGRSRSPVKATIVDPASLPTSPVSPQPVRNIGLAALLGLLVGVGAAVLRETLDTSVKTGDDLAEATAAPLLGSINYDSRAAKQPLVSSLDSHAPRVEAFRVLRTNLQFLDVDRTSKAFVLTSSVPEEGKTTTSINLAITLAQAGQRVVLVEGDLRRPKIPQYLNAEPVVGLTTVLVGRIELQDALQTTGRSGMSILTSGAIPPNPAELLQSQAMARVLEQLRASFDVILIDGPPLLPVTDAAVLAAQSDGAVLVVRHGKTTKEQVRGSAERLEAVGGRMVGLVLNMTPSRGGGRYSYGYGYGYGYAPKRKRKGVSEEPRSEFEEVMSRR